YRPRGRSGSRDCPSPCPSSARGRSACRTGNRRAGCPPRPPPAANSPATATGRAACRRRPCRGTARGRPPWRAAPPPRPPRPPARVVARRPPPRQADGQLLAVVDRCDGQPRLGVVPPPQRADREGQRLRAVPDVVADLLRQRLVELPGDDLGAAVLGPGLRGR